MASLVLLVRGRVFGIGLGGTLRAAMGVKGMPRSEADVVLLTSNPRTSSSMMIEHLVAEIGMFLGMTRRCYDDLLGRLVVLFRQQTPSC